MLSAHLLWVTGKFGWQGDLVDNFGLTFVEPVRVAVKFNKERNKHFLHTHVMLTTVKFGHIYSDLSWWTRY
jgi:hypothetical protein